MVDCTRCVEVGTDLTDEVHWCSLCNHRRKVPRACAATYIILSESTDEQVGILTSYSLRKQYGL